MRDEVIEILPTQRRRASPLFFFPHMSCSPMTFNLT